MLGGLRPSQHVQLVKSVKPWEFSYRMFLHRRVTRLTRRAVGVAGTAVAAGVAMARSGGARRSATMTR